jgi:tetratricopeptide (TPR) repeat protein
MRFLFILLFVANFCWASSPELPPEIQTRLDLFNKGQLIEAYNSLKALEETHSESKEFLFLLAMAKWKMMWLSTFNPSDRAEVTDLLDKVDDMCLPSMEQDLNSQFYHASAIGVRAQIAATEGDWWKTAKLGKKMKGHAAQIVKEDREFYPVYYLLGSYNYFADALPSYMKFLRVLVFLPGGDRKEGLKQLVLGYEKGGISQGEAGKTLAVIYTYYEKKFEDGKKMCEDLLTRYPQSYDVGLYKGINLYFLKDYEASISWFEELQDRIQIYSTIHKSPDSIIPLYRPMEREIRYWVSRGKIQQEKWEEAREILMDLADPPVHQPHWLLRGVYLSLAQIDYHKKNAPRAESWISKVLQWDDAKDSHEKAKKLKKKKGKIGTFDIDLL